MLCLVPAPEAEYLLLSSRGRCRASASLSLRRRKNNESDWLSTPQQSETRTHYCHYCRQVQDSNIDLYININFYILRQGCVIIQHQRNVQKEFNLFIFLVSFPISIRKILYNRALIVEGGDLLYFLISAVNKSHGKAPCWPSGSGASELI